MNRTAVIQSHRTPLPYRWIEACLESVRDWSDLNDYTYRFIGDELFAQVPADLLAKLSDQLTVASDLARLLVLQNVLKEGFGTVIWLDADFLIFDPSAFVIPDQSSAVGREVWVQHDRHGKLKTYKKVHNAFLMFRSDNSLLDFYSDTAIRLLSKNEGDIPPQFIGPKLLTALHNVAIFSVMESAGMLSPLVITDILSGEGAALDQFIAHSPEAIAGANLCVSSCQKGDVSDVQMEQLVNMLKRKGLHR